MSSNEILDKMLLLRGRLHERSDELADMHKQVQIYRGKIELAIDDIAAAIEIVQHYIEKEL